MPRSTAAAAPATDDALPVRVYPPALRAAAAGLLAVSGAVLPILLAWLVQRADAQLAAAEVLRAFLAFSLLPAATAFGLRAVLRAELRGARGALEVRVGAQRLAVAPGDVAALEPWRVPLPEPGLTLRLRSGERFALGIVADDPSTLLARLAAAGIGATAAVETHPTVLYARVKHALARLGRRRIVAKFVLFGVLVAGILFNERQQTAYGAPFGQYELEGLLPMVVSFVRLWAGVTIALLLYAAVWRWPAEIVALAAAHRGEKAATRVRRIVELVCRVAYYGGIPFLLATRLAPPA